ncbi:MAG TPA: hypothetical protein VFM49_30815 [Chloroflexia bacterium]|jgi:hypothetical protein|nr:hypothetical protein [Chloroflexia bacterium]
MSLSDYLKFMRATKGGVTPWEIADATGLSSKDVHLLEVKHRRMGEDDAMLAKLAQYFEVPVDDLVKRRDNFRKRLTGFVADRQRTQEPVVLVLESGEELHGTIAWFGREAVAVDLTGGDPETPLVVQRAVVAEWR